MTQELGQLARANGLDALGYLLDMVRLEADEVSKVSEEMSRQIKCCHRSTPQGACSPMRSRKARLG